jgi:NAD(P)-dependent dehydrogenase (short-subunit alcohol dehydrogenase family)
VDLRIFTEPNLGASYDDLLAVAKAADSYGFDAFFRSDHYTTFDGSPGLPGSTDAWITLAGIARETSRIRLGTLVSPVTFRLPGPLAISVAQVDVMSGGRVELGLGAGWFEPEHTAFAIPFPPTRTRMEMLEEQLAIVSGLWETKEGDRFSFDGAHYAVTDSPALPKPAQSPRPPIGADVSAPDALRDAVIAAKTLGRLRTVCLNAGVTSTGANVWETPAAVLDLMISINLGSLFDSLRLTVPVMASHAQPSRVLITASMAGVVASPGSAAYSASKAGAVAVAKALRAELAVAAPQISVTVLNPGMVRTNLMVNSATRHEASTSMPPELVSGAHVALNEFGQHPDETARIALDDLDAGCFWSMPSADDPFMETLRRELSELG